MDPFENIDKISREAAENLHVPFNEQSWQKMEQMLLAEEQKETAQKRQRSLRRAALLLLFGLSTSVIGYYLGRHFAPRCENATQQVAQQANGTKNTITTIQDSVSNPTSANGVSTTIAPLSQDQPSNPSNVLKSSTEQYTVPYHNNVSTGSHANVSSITQAEVKSDNNFQTAKTNQRPAYKTVVPSQKNPSPALEVDIAQQSNTYNPATVYSVDESTASPINAVAANQLSAVNDTNHKNQAAKQAYKSLVSKNSNPEKPIPSTAPQEPKAKPTPIPEIATPPKPKVAFSVVYGASKSLVADVKHDWVNAHFGIQTAVPLSQKFELNLGIINGEIAYKAKKANYVLPITCSWKDYPIVNIFARTKATHIPISIKYYVSGAANSGLFAQVGVQSLLLGSASHSHYYSSLYNRNSATLKYQNEKDIYFAQLGIGLGYQYKMGRHLSLVANPYFYTPLKKVGLGLVSLRTIGAQIAVKYHPFNNR
jgi:hypothetical protein